MSNRAVLAFCREKEVKAVELRFTDPLGVWRSMTIPVERLTEASFEHGFGLRIASFPGSSPTDRLLIPRADSAFLDPFATISTLILLGSLQDPITRDDDPLESRAVLERAVGYLAGTGIADRAVISIGCEFFVFDDLHVHRDDDSAALNIQAAGHHDCFELRNAVLEHLREAEVPVEQHRGIEGTNKQSFDLEPTNLLAAADALMLFKHVVRRAVARHNKVASFLPQPNRTVTGASLSLKLSLWRGDEPLFGGQAFGGLSEIAMRAMAGILQHTPALTALCNPTTNSFRRLFQRGEPWLLGYSQTHPRSVCRIAASDNHPKLKGITYCLPDPKCNPYLAFSALLMAAVDGIQNKLEPGRPDTIWSGNDSTNKLPRSLWDALDALDADIGFLTRGDVFGKAMLDQWLEYKRNVERAAVEADPTPAEFLQYNFDEA